LYNNARVVAKRWVERAKEIADVGSLILYKQENQMFRRSKWNANEGRRESLLIMLFCWLIQRDAECAPVRVYVSSLGLMVSFVKTKFMVVGKVVSESS